jgi:hypothetical protein
MHVDLFIPAKDRPAKRECDLVFNTAHYTRLREA